jgi:hypothetical protein
MGCCGVYRCKWSLNSNVYVRKEINQDANQSDEEIQLSLDFRLIWVWELLPMQQHQKRKATQDNSYTSATVNLAMHQCSQMRL